MKLSLSWIFEHIDGSWRRYKITDLINKFNRMTAEVDNFYQLKLDFNNFSLAQIQGINFKDIVAFSPEWNKKLSVPLRADIKTGGWFLVKKNGKEIAWATLADFGAFSKDGFMPSVSCSKTEQLGSWKKKIITDDYILELDNTSVTHRADLWGVRGIAREFAALLDLKLKSIDSLLKKTSVKAVAKEYKVKGDQFSIINGATKACRRFGGLYFSEIESRPSSLWMAALLCRVDSRPIDLIVDATNYIMLDLGQPMHAFDAKKVASKIIKPRMAKKGEKLLLLDETTVKLSPDDLVITDGKTPIALAGVMGGLESGISSKTTSMFLESANFESSFVRQTSSRHHLRTDASVRFEKGLDPNQNVTGIRRFLKVLDDAKVSYKLSGPVVSVGKEFVPYKITISHELVERNLGVKVSKKFINETLKKIDFTVSLVKQDVYKIVVPTFRGTKDVTIAVDIIEEIGRFWGWDNIPQVMPTRQMVPNDIHASGSVRAIKQQCAFGMHMHEVVNYPFFDESFLRELQWSPTGSVRAKNPLSQNVTQLVTSLVPHLFKNVQNNITKAEQLRFFELNRIWNLKSKSRADESKSIAGIFWDYYGQQDFYDGKALLSSLFNVLRLSVKWKKVKDGLPAWYNAYQAAELVVGKDVVGYAGMIDAAFAERVALGNAFIFELNADFIINYQLPEVVFKPVAKYPYVHHDISMLVPLECTVEMLLNGISKAHKQIYDVELRDVFSKEEWGGRRSVTLRFYMRDPKKTLAGHEVDRINRDVVASVTKLGAEVR